MKHIYLINIENTDFYKIGFTKQDPGKRLKALQTGNPIKLILTDYYTTDLATEVETAMHNLFSYKKIEEKLDITLLGEWFVLDEDFVNDFKEKCKTIEEGIRAIKESSTLFY